MNPQKESSSALDRFWRPAIAVPGAAMAVAAGVRIVENANYNGLNVVGHEVVEPTGVFMGIIGIAALGLALFTPEKK